MKSLALWTNGTCWLTRDSQSVCEPLPTAGKLSEDEMTHWDDTMVDDPAHVSGWTISGLAVLVAIVTVWILGI
jgi:hypothetical protein